MKKVLLIVLLFSFTQGIFSQEERVNPFSIGAGPEWNMDSRHLFAFGAVLGLTYNLPRNFAVGFDFSASSNFRDTHVFEPDLILRYYFFRPHSGLFVQTDFGAFFMFEEDGTTSLIEFGLRGGYRHLLGNRFFLEPYGRLGFPFAFGLGLIAGVRF